MCGILGYWARESVPPMEYFDTMFTWAERRGQDGVGIWIDGVSRRWVSPYRQVKEEVLNFIQERLARGSILLGICRATPETEPVTTEDHLQPVESFDGTVLVHNGGVADFQVPKSAKIDSEAILEKYVLHDRNMVKAMEELVGSFSVAMYDPHRERIILVSSFTPLAHGYLRGYGYFWHSEADVFKELFNLTPGICVWEDFYYDVLPPYHVIETDLDSGFQRWWRYKPRFLFNGGDYTTQKGKELYLVCASGGIDSGLTAWILRKAGAEVQLVHFDYGHRSEECEWWAVRKLAAVMDCPAVRIPLADVYAKIGNLGMLLDQDAPITSGEELIKTTTAWVPGRNAVFATVLLALGEARVLAEGYDKVTICGGWAQLSEETGGYPDNSYHFLRALHYLKDVGYITGDHLAIGNVLRNLTKTEEWVLGHALGFPFEYTVSCDNPRMGPEGPELCTECGSTRLSHWAAVRAGVKDPRRFYGPPFPEKELPLYRIKPEALVERLQLPEELKTKLRPGR